MLARSRELAAGRAHPHRRLTGAGEGEGIPYLNLCNFPSLRIEQLVPDGSSFGVQSRCLR
jgi:hypothetical protein